MTYNDLLKAHQSYGTTSEDIIKRKGYEKVLESVIIAPWWSHEIFNNSNLRMEQVNDNLFNFYGDNVEFTYIESKSIGAPAIMDFVLSLGVTNCKKLVFLGSSGALDENIKIGDIIIPKYSICADGASRFLNDNLEDEFLKEEYPNKELTDSLLGLLDEDNYKYHYVPNVSVDTMFGQYPFIGKFIELGAKSIEMETACVFKCCEMMGIKAVAVFCVSDNTVINKSLFSGRTPEEKENRYKVRYEIVPKIAVKLLKKEK